METTLNTKSFTASAADKEGKVDSQIGAKVHKAYLT